MTQFILSLPPETVARLKHEAEARGVSPETVAVEMIEAGTADEDLDWEEDVRRLKEPDEDTDARIVFAELRENIEKARRAKP
ncbi:MAG: hypothetical protein SGJ21_14205 [Alphaproteobacteria bacterium]|nr:hypothetical protein [Alphaproteobacteria bacterium]